MYAINDNERKADEVREALRQYGLDTLTDEEDREAANRIAQRLAGSPGRALVAAAQSGTFEQDSLAYQYIIMEQNFLILRQLQRLNQRLDDGAF